MKKLHFRIPLYKVDVTLVQSEDKAEADEVRKILVRNHIGKEHIRVLLSV